jgi:hypothetical protein
MSSHSRSKTRYAQKKTTKGYIHNSRRLQLFVSANTFCSSRARRHARIWDKPQLSPLHGGYRLSDQEGFWLPQNRLVLPPWHPQALLLYWFQIRERGGKTRSCHRRTLRRHLLLVHRRSTYKGSSNESHFIQKSRVIPLPGSRCLAYVTWSRLWVASPRFMQAKRCV